MWKSFENLRTSCYKSSVVWRIVGKAIKERESMERVELGFGEWMGELRSCEDNGDFSPMKEKYVDEDYAEEAREYLRRF
jgi:hypothetical protein